MYNSVLLKKKERISLKIVQQLIYQSSCFYIFLNTKNCIQFPRKIPFLVYMQAAFLSIIVQQLICVHTEIYAQPLIESMHGSRSMAFFIFIGQIVA